MNSCKVSVVVPMYNAQRYIGTCIESVLAQDFSAFELLVVDDGSSDLSAEVVDRHARHDGRIRLLRHPGGVNLGVSRSRKLGIAEASGEFVAFLDADDAFEPTKLGRQIALMESHPDCVLCHTGIRTVVDLPTDQELASQLETYSKQVVAFVNGLSSEVTEYRFLDRPHALRSNPVCNSSTLVHAPALRATAAATRQLFQFEDFSQWALLSGRGPFLFLPDPLTRYRVHGASSTSSLLADPLKKIYSLIECLLVILVHAEDPHLRGLAESELRDSLSRAMDLYAERRPEGIPDGRDAASHPLGETPSDLWEHRARHLQARLSGLEAEMHSISSQLEAIRGSKYYKAISIVKKAMRSVGIR
ncbi:glycosyltransferase family 2 protein [Tautonia plasticadhaerens]|uniref:Glycosyltransferase EpsH n=1 Tax=Tautonia plasticadhaerens TaxID=2527974 RepID=A0A518H5Y9_9BACT|nr:glycosyltransferase family A protein [Tautonia plasticadhaerens]QDV36256.1 Putative glycosyltransferase EpsH [Tautonia plasticadhaerens]